jgi:hypothetical protein
MESIYGLHTLPFELKEKNITISVRSKDSGYIYIRETHDEKVEKLLFTKRNEIYLCPVEPVNLTKTITPFLLIELQKPLLVEPKTKNKVYIRFPIEIGAFFKIKGDYDNFDIFTFTKPKYTLYGDVRRGVVCKYYKSDVNTSIPKTDILKEGVIELRIENDSSEWVEVKKAVFNSFGMKIYYNDKLVSMIAKMKILNSSIAETGFSDAPLIKGMDKSVEIYTSRKITLSTAKFVMEAGV